MIEIYKKTAELKRDSTSSNRDIDELLQEVRKAFKNVFFVETVNIEDRGFFTTKKYTRYCLYYVSQKEQDRPGDVKAACVVNLNEYILQTCFEDFAVVLYLKGLLDAYRLVNLAP
jgi:hypothetical protein